MILQNLTNCAGLEKIGEKILGDHGEKLRKKMKQFQKYILSIQKVILKAFQAKIHITNRLL